MSHSYARPIRNVSCLDRSPVQGRHRLRRQVVSQVRPIGRVQDDCRSSPRRLRQPQALLCHSSGGNSTGHLCHDRSWPSARRQAPHPDADGHTHHPLRHGERANHAQAPMVVDPPVLRQSTTQAPSRLQLELMCASRVPFLFLPKLNSDRRYIRSVFVARRFQFITPFSAPATHHLRLKKGLLIRSLRLPSIHTSKPVPVRPPRL